MNKYKIHQQLVTDEVGACEVVAIYKLEATDIKRAYDTYAYVLLDTDGLHTTWAESEITLR